MKKNTIQDMQKIAESRGGKCLSDSYIDSKTKLKWQCKEGHTWKANSGNIKSAKWCPICSAGLNERICRKFFETLFQKDFPRARPKWLMGSKGRSFELDGYCKDLELAFEYHGEQHYQLNKRFHERIPFEQRKEYDRLKREFCRQNNVVLIEIPYTVKPADMQKYINSKCLEQDIHPPETQLIDYKQFEGVYSPNLLEKTKNIAESKGGKCLSTKYIDSDTKLEYECKNGHRWFVRPSNIARGIWCPRCSGTVKHTLEDMQKLARYKGGNCLSVEYFNTRTKLEWQCKFGHIWKTIPASVIQGYWCPECAQGRTPWNKGKPMSEETKRKLRESLKGRPSPMKGKKTGKPSWNRRKIEKQCLQCGKTFFTNPSRIKDRRGRYCSRECVDKARAVNYVGEKNPFFRKHHSEKSREKMSEALMGRVSGMFGKHHSEETKRKISETKRGKFVEHKEY
jgi:hypothetical protein